MQAVGVGSDGGAVDPEWTGRAVGIDIDPRRASLSRANFRAAGLANRYTALEGDAARKIQDYAALLATGGSDAGRLRGVAIACLPQVPLDAETQSSADGFDPRLPSFDRVKDLRLRGRPAAAYGLTLNAAWLTALRDCANERLFRLLVVVSDRVPRDVVAELFAATGWEPLRTFATPTPVRQVRRRVPVDLVSRRGKTGPRRSVGTAKVPSAACRSASC